MTAVPVPCERCGVPAAVEWVDVSSYAEQTIIMGRSECVTPGCVDETGSAAVLPPETPGELTRADQLWLRACHRFLAEFRKINAAFLKMLAEMEMR